MSEEKVVYQPDLVQRISSLEATVTTLVGQIHGLAVQVEKLQKENAPVAAEASDTQLVIIRGNSKIVQTAEKITVSVLK